MNENIQEPIPPVGNMQLENLERQSFPVPENAPAVDTPNPNNAPDNGHYRRAVVQRGAGEAFHINRPQDGPRAAHRNRAKIVRRPQVVIVIPQWFSDFFLVQKAWKTVLFSLGLVAAIGLSVYFAREAIVLDSESAAMAASGYGNINMANVIVAPPVGTKLPRVVETHLANFEEPLGDDDIPFFWHIPRAGGKTIMSIIGTCLNLVQAADVGGRDDNTQSKEFEIIETETGRFANLDTYTIEGIEAAKKVNFIADGKVDAVTSPYPVYAASLFAPKRQGRLFTFIRHPVDRANSYFHYISQADFDPNYSPDLADVSIDDYAKTPRDRPEFNWMTKSLTNKFDVPSNELTEDDLNVAKEFLKDKFVIGLLDNKGDSMLRFEMYFKWQYEQADDKICEEKLLHWTYHNQNTHPDIEPGSEAYVWLERRNYLDMQLYEYAKVLFIEQEKFFYQ